MLKEKTTGINVGNDVIFPAASQSSGRVLDCCLIKYLKFTVIWFFSAKILTTNGFCLYYFLNISSNNFFTTFTSRKKRQEVKLH